MLYLVFSRGMRWRALCNGLLVQKQISTQKTARICLGYVLARAAALECDLFCDSATVAAVQKVVAVAESNKQSC